MSAMKFSFVSPSPAPETPGKVEAAWPPLGILYCATLLAENGTEVSVLLLTPRCVVQRNLQNL